MNRSGFSLVELMIAAGIMIILALGTSTLLLNQQKEANMVGFVGDANIFNQSVRALLSDSKACTETFAGKSAVSGSSFSLTNLMNGSGGVRYTIDGIYENRSVTLTSMLVDNFDGTGASTEAKMTLSMNLKSNKPSSGPQVVQKKVDIKMQLNGSNQIINCVALANSSDGIWQVQAGNMSNIFYVAPSTGGNVGIGTPSPESSLSIVSDTAANPGIKVYNSSTGTGIGIDAYFPTVEFNRWHDGANPRAFGNGYTGVLNMDPASGDFSFLTGNNPGTGNIPTQTQAFTIKNNGHVGIGTSAPDVGRLQVRDSGVSSEIPIAIDGPAGSARELLFATNSAWRWFIGASSDAESGSDAGTDFFIDGYSDTGVWRRALSVKRSTGNVGIGTIAPAVKLDVAGYARLGTANTGSGCSIDGAFGYDYTTHRPVFCNGTSWKLMSPNIQRGTVNPAVACHGNVCSYAVSFPTPFSTTPTVMVIPQSQDFGHVNAAISTAVTGVTTNGFNAVFDHIGNPIDNNFLFYWIAIEN